MIIKMGNRPMDIDLPSNRITLKDTRFYMTEKGVYVPSVTTVLDGAYPKGAQYFEWLKKNGEDADEIRDEAGRKGSAVHNMTEKYDNGEEVTLLDVQGNLSMSLAEWNMFEKYVEFSKREKPENHMIEQNLVSDTLEIGGTLDRLCTLRGRKTILDIKTGAGIYSHYWCQMAAYGMMLSEHGIEYDDIAILWLNAKTRTDGKGDAIQGKGWQIVRPDREISYYWDLFKAVKKVWSAEYGSMVPKETTYSITHKK